MLCPGAQQYGDLRLEDGTLADSGRVEIFRNGVWGTINAGTSNSDQSGPAQTICRQLGYYDTVTFGTVAEMG